MPATPGTDWPTAEFSMWQLLVPMTMTSVSGSAAPAPGTPACASMIAALTGVPARSPKRFASAAVSPPAHSPGARKRPGIFSATTFSKRGCSARKNSRDGKPSSRLHMPL